MLLPLMKWRNFRTSDKAAPVTTDSREEDRTPIREEKDPQQ